MTISRRLVLTSIVTAVSIATAPLTLRQQPASSSAAAVTLPDPFAALRSIAAGAGDSVSHDHESRFRRDLEAMDAVRPGHTFWQHVFTIADGAIAYGSAADGRLLAVFPTRGDWQRSGVWHEASLAAVLESRELPANPDARREYVARLIAHAAGPIVHNATRGEFVRPNAERYGTFLHEWGAIYERFGVAAEIGLAQAIVESGLNGTRKSEASAIGFCQWLAPNWKQLDKLAPAVIEAGNQTTQAAYCAAYLSVLATKYGSFIPALSEHHAGGTNVGRTLINGERLGGADVRAQYFLGAQWSRNLRSSWPERYADLYGSYGPRSYAYAEMIFGNRRNVAAIAAAQPQQKIHAMRTSRAVALAEIVQRTGLPADEIKRFNPALVKRVPAHATLYLPSHVAAFGKDVAFWRRPPGRGFASALRDFESIAVPPSEWDEPSFQPVLREFVRRFAATGTEEGAVMATVLTYVANDAASSRRRTILAEFRTRPDIRLAFDDAFREYTLLRAAADAGGLDAAAVSP